MTSIDCWKDALVKENEWFQKFQLMIAKCLAPLYVIMPVFIAQDVVISSLLLNLFSKVSMKIMSLSFNRVYDQALFIFLRKFSYKDSQTHFWSLTRSHRRNSFLLPKSVSLLEFWKKLILYFDSENNLIFIQKLYF